MPLMHQYVAGPGLALRNYGVSTPTCCPSRLSLLTSKFVHNHNITANYLPYGGYERFGQMMAASPRAPGPTAGLDAGWLPSQLQAAGYSTYLVGKFLNEFTPAGAPGCPRGWTALDALVDPWVYTFFGPVFSRDCDPALQRYSQDDYSTDVIRDKGVAYIREAVSAGRPFFLELTPVAPHEACTEGESGQWCGDPLPAPRHSRLFADATIPSTPSWLTPFDNPVLTGRLQPPQRASNGTVIGPYAPPSVRRLTQRQRARLQSLQAVDELVRDVVLELEVQGVLDNTYIIYMSDNGYHMGQHNANAGKYMPWEEDVRVPFFIRGPGVPAGMVSDYPAAVVDVAATIVNLAGLPLPADWDGYPLPLHRLVPPGAPGLDARPWRWEPSAAAGGSGYFREAIPIEMWVFQPGNSCHKLNYRSVRVCSNYLAFGSPADYQQAMANAVGSSGSTSSGGAPAGSTLGLGTLLFGAAGRDAAGDTLGTSLAPLLRAQQQQGQGQQPAVGTCYKYNIWCWGPRELYDIGLDPYETQNRFSDPQAQRLLGRLDALLNVMGYCRGARCREAYGAILATAGAGSSSSNVAGGKMVVANFSDLMDPRYDSLFAKLPRFQFKRCSPALIPAANEAAWYRGE
ncbi:hypothetical protein HXX76_003654 [Chlamydomonas incerta]|uniref:Sulfatase N-terminal domain-containing protein n=1 Tax=Chlamydomonas incerta TaxID=51695 RepID=A0A835T8K1_CHLIN|nr:hypothetical protein HXX76_003654 [Chlamydomonas incerta]|eukprot:KAG2440799.1 hypothetical protein HXX76_003654 [Chlamydomonas incerta]